MEIEIDIHNKIIFTGVQYIQSPDSRPDTLLCSPKLVSNDDTLDIGYMSGLCGFFDTYKISPNKQFIILHRLDEGWVGDIKANGQIDSIWHERYSCYLIDIKTASQLELGCDGEWNSENKWILN